MIIPTWRLEKSIVNQLGGKLRTSFVLQSSGTGAEKHFWRRNDLIFLERGNSDNKGWLKIA